MNILRKIQRGQGGQALILAMVMLALGGLIIGPLVNLVATSLNVGKHIEIQVEDYYAADAGVENAIWYIRQDPQDELVVPKLVGEGNALQHPVNGVNGENLQVTITKTGSNSFKIESQTTSGPLVKVTAILVRGNLDIFDGALVSSSDITLKKDAVVNGDIYCLDDFTYHGSLTGDYNIYDSNTNPDIVNYLTFPLEQENAEFAARFEQLAKDAHNDHSNYTIGSSGVYGSMYVNGYLKTAKNKTIFFSGGAGLDGILGNSDDLPAVVYVNGYIDIGSDTTIDGNVSFVAVGNIGLEKVANFGNSASLIMSTTGSIDFRKEVGTPGPDGIYGTADDSPLEALIYAPNGGISFKKDGTVSGSVISGRGIDVPQDISADKNFKITYDPVYKDTMSLPGFNSSAIRAWDIS